MYIKTKKTEYSRTTRQSQLAAMKYLSEKKPGKYKFVKQKFATHGANLEYRLFEKFFDDKKKEVWQLIGFMGYKLNFMDWN